MNKFIHNVNTLRKPKINLVTKNSSFFQKKKEKKKLNLHL